MIEVARDDDVCTLRVKGDINHMEMVNIRNEISELIKEGSSKVILSMEDVKHINYLSIGVLVERMKRLRNCGGDLKLVGMDSYLKNIFKVVGVEDIFEIFDSIEDALKSYISETNQKLKAC